MINLINKIHLDDSEKVYLSKKAGKNSITYNLEMINEIFFLSTILRKPELNQKIT